MVIKIELKIEFFKIFITIRIINFVLTISFLFFISVSEKECNEIIII